MKDALKVELEEFNMIVIEQYDEIEMMDGTEGCVVEVFISKDNKDEDMFLVDIGDSPSTWQTIDVSRHEIKRVLRRHK